MSKTEETSKKAVFLDGVQTRTIIDLHKEYKRKNLHKLLDKN